MARPGADAPTGRGARAVRAALTAGLEHRAPAQGRLSAELSGDLAATSLCFLADRHTPDLLTLRWRPTADDRGDTAFAVHAVRSLEDAEHLSAARRDLPAAFTDPHVPAGTEEPYPFARTTAQAHYTAQLLARHGSRRHLSGGGAAELLQVHPGYLHRLLRRHPLTALRHVRCYRATDGWSLWDALGRLARPESAAAWWHAQAEQLTGPEPPGSGWGPRPLRAPGWVTGACTDQARDALRRTAEHAAPLAADPGQHQSLLALRSAASRHRMLRQLYAGSGLDLDLPFYDDRIAEAVLAVRPQERGPGQDERLLFEAMRGIVPAAVLERVSPAGPEDDVRAGIHRNRSALVELFADSELAARGLIDVDRLGERLTARPDTATATALEDLLGVETWLRGTTASRPVPRRPDLRAGTG
ncbi:asparagine synthase-related protein [Saccharopolyspora sp. CA-218241]|uniref:asparagine synthase-related protein n=1 Tax=Saccharopolyspora sp. CA-218241 TaxID=3240027 RepID=UPI003D998652